MTVAQVLAEGLPPATAALLESIVFVWDRLERAEVGTAQLGRSTGLWWHDLPYPSRDCLLRRHLIEDDDTHGGCGSHGKTHPGYVRPTVLGLAVAQAVRAQREEALAALQRRSHGA